MPTQSKHIAEDAPTMQQAVTKAGNMSKAGLAELFLHGIKDMYYAEKKIYKSLPKMIKAAQASELAGALSDHHDETQEHITKLEKVFALLDQSPKSTKCAAVDGILDEAGSIMEEFGKTRAGDAALIFAAQAVEHYEITRYGSLHAFAHVLGYEEAALILASILEQEKGADGKLNELAEGRIDFAAVNQEQHIEAEAMREVSH